MKHSYCLGRQPRDRADFAAYSRPIGRQPRDRADFAAYSRPPGRQPRDRAGFDCQKQRGTKKAGEAGYEKGTSSNGRISNGEIFK